MTKTRTIIIAVDDINGHAWTSVNIESLTAAEARSAAIDFAVKRIPGMNYWYRPVVHYKGSRLAIVHATRKGT